MEICELSAIELNRKMQGREVGFLEAVDAYISRIEKIDPRINTYISTTFETAREKAKALQARLNKNERLSVLAGVPFALKDNICVENVELTCASGMLKGFVPPYTATAAARLLENDAVLLGKLNMDEFAMGGSNETSYFGTVKNPWDPQRVPGGSSGGSAASTAARIAAFTLGSDTGGSVRQPASFCGVTGLKPTYGRISRYGLVAFASSLDQIGPVTRGIQDCAAVLSVIAGQDPMDSTSSYESTADYHACLKGNIKGMRFAYPKEYFEGAVDIDVKETVLRAFRVLEKSGASVEEIALPLTEYAIPAYYLISSAEASSNLSRYDGIKYGHRAEGAADLAEIYVKSRTEGFGTEVKRRILLGTYALSSGYYDAYYIKASKVRDMIRRSFTELFTKYDAVIGPVAPTAAYKIGEKTADPLEMYLGDIYTVSANIAGIPAISIPAGFDRKGLPIGLQIMCDFFSEQKLLDIAYAYQNETEHHMICPKI